MGVGAVAGGVGSRVNVEFLLWPGFDELATVKPLLIGDASAKDGSFTALDVI